MPYCRNGPPRLTGFAAGLALASALALAAGAAPARADADPAALCEHAAVTAARTWGIPQDVMTALALTETGIARSGQPPRPWPWALNIGGHGQWFATRAKAEQALTEAIARGTRSIDIGCFQINLHWHGGAFASPEAMLSPRDNAAHAARLLAGHHADAGDWILAAGAYHSRTTAIAARYRVRFAAHLAALAGAYGARQAATAPVPAARAPRRLHDFPLFRAGQGAAAGSLVPLSGASGGGP